MASIGPLALAAAGITKGLDRATPGRPWLKPVLGGTLLFILALLTWRQAGTFADLETLWRATIQRNPGSFMARNNLANLLLEKGRVDEAIVQYRQAQEIEPDEAAAAYNLGR